MSGLKEVLTNLHKWANDKRAGCEAVSLTTCADMQNYARLNRPWQDQTGNARAGLNGGTYWETMDILKIYIAHSMEYGVYLELCNEGKYAILSPTIKEFQDKWYSGIKKIMEK